MTDTVFKWEKTTPLRAKRNVSRAMANPLSSPRRWAALVALEKATLRRICNAHFPRGSTGPAFARILLTMEKTLPCGVDFAFPFGPIQGNHSQDKNSEAGKVLT